jgi:site-specific DNA-methyltransferase (adenine-specific)
MTREIYYGDNLEILRKYIRDESVALCYIDPPFNSKRTYNQIYNNLGEEDTAQVEAFVDTWIWDDSANAGFSEILANEEGRFSSKTVDLIKGLQPVLGKGSLLAYLVSITLRIVEVRRVLSKNGSFYLHCDPTASHYLKILLDTVFVPDGGDFQNEIVWNYATGGAPKGRYARKHDVIFFFTKTNSFTFNSDAIREPRTEKSLKRAKNPKGARIGIENTEKLPTDVFQIQALNPMAKERMGYPTQKPEALLERIILASSNEGDVVLDAYCGCGTTVAVAERLNRSWIGIDITYQSISLILRRLEGQYGMDLASQVVLNGIPRDIESAKALALKKDDRVRKEFEKWAILTYSSNRARINDKKGGDLGIDGVAYFMISSTENAKVVFQVKSGNVGRGDISKLNNDRDREGADLAIFISLSPSTQGMREEASSAGLYQHPLMGRAYPRIQIVTIEDMMLRGALLDLPMHKEVLKQAEASDDSIQPAFL